METETNPETRPSLAELVAKAQNASNTDPTWRADYRTAPTTPAHPSERKAMAAEFVERTHMHDWTQNERRQELASALDLTATWNSRAAYMEARHMAGLEN